MPQYRVSWVDHRERTWESWYYVRLPGFHTHYPRQPGPIPPDAPPGLDLDYWSLARAQQPGRAGTVAEGARVTLGVTRRRGLSECGERVRNMGWFMYPWHPGTDKSRVRATLGLGPSD